MQSVLADPRASLDDMIELVYGPENPVTDETVIPKSPAQSAHVDEPPAVVVPNVEREPVDQFGKAWYAPAATQAGVLAVVIGCYFSLKGDIRERCPCTRHLGAGPNLVLGFGSSSR